MTSDRQLKSKIRTIGNIKQITKAMQMVSATKMRKSQEVALRARPFAKETLSLLKDIVSQREIIDEESIYFKEQKEGKICLIVVTSDKGLCGSFNSQITRAATKWLLNKNNTDVVAVGKKGRDFFRAKGIEPAKEFLLFSDIVTLHDVTPLSEWILKSFEERKYKRIVIVYTQFVSALVQKSSIRQLLPLNIEELENAVKDIVPKTGKYAEWESKENNEVELSHLLEPSPEVILQSLMKSLLRIQVLHYIFESNASEHSSRMVAMKNATENATSLQDELQLALNKARQAAITQELTEISTAKEALSQD